MKLINLLRESLKLRKIALILTGLGLLIPIAVDLGYVGILTTGFLAGYIIIGAIFSIWIGRWTITTTQILRYLFKVGEEINDDHGGRREEILTWCNENTSGFIYVEARTEFNRVFESEYFFFKKKKDRLFFKMVWG